ncbi:MAG: response regulator [Thermodesulfobacteriota bacterium]|nr:response regulator [Thermodesulfobacteriota bacterium]
MSEKPTYEELARRVRKLEKAESDCKKAEEALRESEERFRQLFENMSSGVVIYEAVDNGGDFIFHDLNRATERIEQLTRGDLIGKRVTSVFPGVVEFGLLEILQSVWRTGKPKRHPVKLYRDERIKGWRENYVYKLPSGKIVAIYDDITSRKEAEDDREKLLAYLSHAQKMKAIGTLAGGIAHNFNNILMGIQGRTSLMMVDKDPHDPDREHLRGIEEYVKNAAEVTRDLLGFARGGKYEVKPTDLNILIKHENKMFSSTKKEIRFHEEYEMELWAVEADQGQIQQVLLNLYVNAWQAMPGGGDLYLQTENVTLDEEFIKPFGLAPGRYVKVSVTDTGVGMDGMTLEKIFDPFFSTRDVGQGSGLGLASVYGIIRNHSGFINVYSEKSAGTTFNIYLPALETKPLKACKGPKPHEIKYGHGTILLADDEVMVVEVGQAMLERLGYRVLTAWNGQQALEIYEKNTEEIDLVILDMIMPGIGAGETIDRIKKIDEDVKVLLSSGYSINGQAREILDRGCTGFIQKPFSLKDLSRKVRDALDYGKRQKGEESQLSLV